MKNQQNHGDRRAGTAGFELSFEFRRFPDIDRPLYGMSAEMYFRPQKGFKLNKVRFYRYSVKKK